MHFCRFSVEMLIVGQIWIDSLVLDDGGLARAALVPPVAGLGVESPCGGSGGDNSCIGIVLGVRLTEPTVLYGTALSCCLGRIGGGDIGSGKRIGGGSVG